MHLNEKIDGYINAQRWVNNVSVIDILVEMKTHMDKLENDQKVLRWALSRARDALLNTNNGHIVSLLDTAQSMTEPSNDR